VINVKHSLDQAFKDHSLNRDLIRCARVLTDTDEERVVSLPERFTANEYAAFWADLDFAIPEHQMSGCVWLHDRKWMRYSFEEMEWVMCMMPFIPPGLRRDH
jgi:hypothetical protein